MAYQATSPSRRRVNNNNKDGGGAHSFEMTPAVEEVKEGNADMDKNLTVSESRMGISFQGYDEEAPAMRVLSPTKPPSSVMQTAGVDITFHKLSLTAHYVSARMKRKQRRILKGISGLVKKGTMTALMGPSGCGKTSLLHTLAGKNDKTNIQGHILVDGRPREQGFAYKIGYVEQDDQLMGVMSVRENLMFSASLRLPVSIPKVDRVCRVEDTIELLGLWKCANSKIGTEMIRGVSGGERKRTSIGMELVTDPAVIFLDEPTSGLDAFTAHRVVEILADLAANGKTVVLSIHQPRYSVFKLFDSLMLLAEGEMVYQGPATKGIDYFTSIGFECEPFNNPCDFFMDVVCDQVRRLERQISHGGSVHVQEGGYLSKSFKNSAQGKDILTECEDKVVKSGATVDHNRKVDKHIRRYATSFFHQIAVVSQRSFVAVIRNPATSVLQILAFVLSALIVGAFYHNKLNDGPSALEDRVGCQFIISYMVIFGQLTSIELFIQERALFIHEKTSGFYRTSAYFLAKIFCDILPTRVVPTIFFALISVFMIGLRSDPYHIVMYWLTLTATNLASTSLCLMVSSMVPVYSIGFLVAALFNVFFMISSGFLLNANSIPDYLIPFKYLSIFRYNLNNLLTLDLHGRQFHCPGVEQMAATKQFSMCAPTGDLYLEAKHIKNDVWGNIGALLIMTPCYLLIAYFFLRRLKKKA